MTRRTTRTEEYRTDRRTLFRSLSLVGRTGILGSRRGWDRSRVAGAFPRGTSGMRIGRLRRRSVASGCRRMSGW
jgi:hypothetical protein